jgi:hypothetical protein
MDYYIRFTDKLTILTDAQGILFLSMCKESQGILLRFSLELSKYQAEIVHVPGKDNETADVLSRHHPEIEKIQQEEMEQKPMTESQAMQILEIYAEVVTFVAGSLEAGGLPGSLEIPEVLK